MVSEEMGVRSMHSRYEANASEEFHLDLSLHPATRVNGDVEAHLPF